MKLKQTASNSCELFCSSFISVYGQCKPLVIYFY